MSDEEALINKRIDFIDRQIKNCDEQIRVRDEMIEGIDTFVKLTFVALLSPFIVGGLVFIFIIARSKGFI